ncbi:MAG TPA: tRNA (N(6)-L-threonylcarbamoyladenosine(37)-C(2))-methylthiotransferase MtaB [Candidatus Marinimicrobia bacterium]|nr:tRNA (N(6)-L-threonylcarbamoyladenosine(37)-C(2))-methylthiotransferase MtaB [Candidatus Neomarinimicrobiota bacterium]
MIKTVNFRTLGCRLNQSESDSIQYELQNAGFTIVGKKVPSDLTIINSCAVTRQAEAKTRGAIAAARRISPNGKIAVIGCYAQLSAQDLKHLSGVNLILGNNEKYRIMDFLNGLEKSGTEIHVSDEVGENTFSPPGIISRGTHTRAHMKIQEGCDYRCAYCVIPLLRGGTRSRNFADCIDEAKLLADQGIKEIVLSGINIGTYMNGERDLTDLIESLLKETDIQRLRISSIEPDLIPDRLIALMKHEPRICRHFHIPLQHGSNEILGLMRRRYRVESYIELVEKIAGSVPEICIGTDVLVGFPGESEEHFMEMAKLLERLPLAYFHVFRFSARPETVAWGLNDNVKIRDKKIRSEQLRKLSAAHNNHFLRRFVGKKLQVLFEKKNKSGLYEGLSDNYIKVSVKSKEPLINQIKNVAITQINGAVAQGEVIICE